MNTSHWAQTSIQCLFHIGGTSFHLNDVRTTSGLLVTPPYKTPIPLSIVTPTTAIYLSRQVSEEQIHMFNDGLGTVG